LFYVKTHENAEDVVEEVFVKFIRQGSKVLDIDNTAAYLFRIAKNESLNFLKKNRHHSFRLESIENEEDFRYPVNASPEDALQSAEFESYIERIIESFPPKRQLIFRMSREENITYKEVAELLNSSVKTIESHMTVALKTLRKAVVEYNQTREVPSRFLGVR
jgi:RNA polymerase sigma-70 factor (ECF subfamily)